MKSYTPYNWHQLQRKVMTLTLFLSFAALQSQELSQFGKLQLRIDTNRYLFLSVTPNINGINYDYLYKIGSDTLFCTKSIFAQGTTSTAIKIENSFKSFLEKELIQGFNKVKIDLKHTSIEHSFGVSCVIFSGALERWVLVLDDYYLSQLYPLLVTFDGFLPAKEKYSLEFNKTVRERFALGQFIDMTIGRYEEENQSDNKRISLDLEKNSYTISFYDSVEKKITYKPLNLNSKTLSLFKSETLKCVNSFSAESSSLKVMGQSSKMTLLRYQFPGIYIETRVKSLDKRTRNVHYDRYFNFLNSILGKKYNLTY